MPPAAIGALVSSDGRRRRGGRRTPLWQRGFQACGDETRRSGAFGRRTQPGGRPRGGAEQEEDEGKDDPAEHAFLPGMKKPAGTEAVAGATLSIIYARLFTICSPTFQVRTGRGEAHRTECRSVLVPPWSALRP